MTSRSRVLSTERELSDDDVQFLQFLETVVSIVSQNALVFRGLEKKLKGSKSAKHMGLYAEVNESLSQQLLTLQDILLGLKR